MKNFEIKITITEQYQHDSNNEFLNEYYTKDAAGNTPKDALEKFLHRSFNQFTVLDGLMFIPNNTTSSVFIPEGHITSINVREVVYDTNS